MPKPKKITTADLAKSILANPNADPTMRAAASMIGKPGPIDPIDASNIQRSYRARDHLDGAGFDTSATPPGTYPRGVSIAHHSGHVINLTPNEGGGWHARISSLHDDNYYEKVHQADLHTDESHLAGALRVHLARPDVQAAMRRP